VIRSIAIAAGLGAASAYSWLKIPNGRGDGTGGRVDDVAAAVDLAVSLLPRPPRPAVVAPDRRLASG